MTHSIPHSDPPLELPWLEGVTASVESGRTQREGEPWHEIRLTDRPKDAMLFYEGNSPDYQPPSYTTLTNLLQAGARVRLLKAGGFSNPNNAPHVGKTGNDNLPIEPNYLIDVLQILGDDGAVVLTVRNRLGLNSTH